MSAILERKNEAEALKDVEIWLQKAYYEGERIIFQGKDGAKAAIVPIEDLEVLEELERND